jgi:murein DD-endopeptidase MepM/ murein hydrolase activator NlpD
MFDRLRVRCVAALCCAALVLSACSAPQTAATQRYQDDAAGYAFDYPPDAVVQVGEDAGLAYPLVHVRLPVTDTPVYQGFSVLVIEDAAASPRTLLEKRAGRADVGEALAVPAGDALRVYRAMNGPDAGRINTAIDFAAQSVLVQGPGVVYRISLFGGGIGGPVEPSPQALEQFEAVLRTFRLTGSALKPRAVRVRAAGEADIRAATADVFSYPLQNGNGVNYGVPVGRVLNGTRMEWLDYAIRNLDQWRIKCYGVDWSRMIHTGEDWYRLDYLTANSAGTPVYAVADGVVVRHNPGLSYPGNVVVVRHALPEGRSIYSMYGHIANVSVIVGDTVRRGQQIATIYNQGYVGRTPSQHPSWDSHLHFEMRWIQDAGNIYEPGTNAYGYNYPNCTWTYPGRGYTYRINPNDYPYPGAGYVDPSDFIAARLAPDDPSRAAIALQTTPSATETITPTETVTPTTPPVTAQPTSAAPVTRTSWLPMVARPVVPVEPICANVLVNGGFEASTGWAGIANTSGTIYSEGVYSAARARNGARSGRVGSININGYWNEILQTAVLPTDTISATLTLWRFLDTSETSTSTAYDVFRIGLETDEGIELIAPRRVDNTSTGRNTWVSETIVLADVGALTRTLGAPQTPGSVWITIKGTTDGNNQSALYVDDVELIACRR